MFCTCHLGGHNSVEMNDEELGAKVVREALGASYQTNMPSALLLAAQKIACRLMGKS